MKRIPLIVLLAAGLLLPKLLGAVPLYLNYQGRMTQTGGLPVPDCLTNTVTINIYSVASGGTALWTEPESVASKNGLFSVELGHSSAMTLSFDQPYWLEIVWWGTTMAPRQALDTSPYAFRAATADQATTATAAAGLILPQALSYAGAGNPALSGSNSLGTGLQGRGATMGVQGQALASGASGVYADYNGIGGAYALSVSGPARFLGGPVSFTGSVDFSGAAVTGLAGGVPNPLSLTGANASGGILSGTNSAVSGAGVVGQGQAYGVSGVAASATGAGVYATNSISAGYAMQAYNPGGVALYAQGAISVTTGSEPAIYVQGPSGSFLPGIKSLSGGTGHAVEGSNSLYGGLGVLGGDLTTGYPGVYGINSTNSSQSFGVHGESPFAVGVLGDGAVGVEGKVTATGQVGLLGDYGNLGIALRVSGPAQFWGGPVSFTGGVDFSGATVTGLSGGVPNPLSLSNNQVGAIIAGTNTSGNGVGVAGSGANAGVSGTASFGGTGVGVLGQANSATGYGVQAVNASGVGLFAQGQGGISVTTSTTVPAIYAQGFAGGFAPAVKVLTSGTGHGVEATNTFGGGLGILGGNLTNGQIGVYGSAVQGPAGIMGEYATGPGLLGQGLVGVEGKVTSTGQTGMLADGGGALGTALKVSGTALFYGGPVSFTSAVDFTGATVTGLATGVPVPLTLTGSTPVIGAVINGINNGAGWGLYGRNSQPGSEDGQGNILTPGAGVYGITAVSLSAGVVGVSTAVSSSAGVVGIGQTGIFGQTTAAGGNGGEFQASNGTAVDARGLNGASFQAQGGVALAVDAGTNTGTALNVTRGFSSFSGPVSMAFGSAPNNAALSVSDSNIGNGGSAIAGYINVSGSAAVYGQSYDTVAPGPGSPSSAGMLGRGAVGVIGQNSIPAGVGVVGNIDASGNTNSMAVFGINGGLGAGVRGQGVTGVAGSASANGGVGVFASDNGMSGASALIASGASNFMGPVNFYGPVSGLPGVNVPLNLTASAAAPVMTAQNNGNGPGISGTALVANQAGVVGENDVFNGLGLLGLSANGLGIVGVGGAVAVSATATGATGIGVYARDNSVYAAIEGINDNTSVSNSAIYGQTKGGYGVYGYSLGANGVGVMGQGNIIGVQASLNGTFGDGFNDNVNTSGNAAYLVNTGGNGVYGSGTTHGVQAGLAANTGDAFYANVSTTGNAANLNNSGSGAALNATASTAGNVGSFSNSGSGAGVYGATGAYTFGVIGSNTTNSGYSGGVRGTAGAGLGVEGDATTGTGVYGTASGAGGTGVFGQGVAHGMNATITGGAGDAYYANIATTGNVANFQNTGTGGGLNTIITGGSGGATSVWGQNSSTGGGSVGVRGTSSGASGINYGLYGDDQSASGVGVYGINSGGGNGVAGNSSGAGHGVVGSASGSGNGVVGSSTGTGAGGQFSGVTGVAAVGTQVGVVGSTTSSPPAAGFGTGVYGVNTSASGNQAAVYGNSTGGQSASVGVLGNASGAGTAIVAQLTTPASGSAALIATNTAPGGYGVKAVNSAATTGGGGAALYVNGPIQMPQTGYTDGNTSGTSVSFGNANAVAGRIVFSAGHTIATYLVIPDTFVTANSVVLVSFSSVNLPTAPGVMVEVSANSFKVMVASSLVLAAGDAMNFVVINY